jgi:hypothetical protein
MSNDDFSQVNRNVVRDRSGFELRLKSGGFNYVMGECVTASRIYPFDGRFLRQTNGLSLAVWDDVFPAADPDRARLFERLTAALAFQGILLKLMHRFSASEAEARRSLNTARIWADTPERVSKYTVDYDLVGIAGNDERKIGAVTCHSHLEAMARARAALSADAQWTAVAGKVVDVELFRVERADGR